MDGQVYQIREAEVKELRNVSTYRYFNFYCKGLEVGIPKCLARLCHISQIIINNFTAQSFSHYYKHKIVEVRSYRKKYQTVDYCI